MQDLTTAEQQSFDQGKNCTDLGKLTSQTRWMKYFVEGRSDCYATDPIHCEIGQREERSCVRHKHGVRVEEVVREIGIGENQSASLEATASKITKSTGWLACHVWWRLPVGFTAATTCVSPVVLAGR